MLRCLAIAIFFLFSITESFAQPLNANAGPNKNICSGASTTLGATPAATGGTGSYTYSWSPATGLSCTNCPNPVCTATTSTTYTLTVDDGNNTDNDNVNVNVTQGATASFTFSPNNSCSSIPVVFANTSTPLAGSSFQWNFGDPASGSANTSTQMNPTHTFVAPGNGTQTFTVSLTVTSSTGCTHTTTQNVTVNQSPAPELIDPFTSFRNCDGSIFNMEVFDNTNPTTNNSYVINWGDGTPDFVAGAGTFPAGSVTHTYSTMGIYTLTYTVTGTNGCANTFTQFVSNITNPAIGVSNPGNTNGCGPITLCFPLSSFAGNHSSTTYRVNYGDGSPEDIFTHPPPATVCHTYTQSSCSSAGGAYTFSITARNSCDSSTATVTPIRVYTAPQANFSASPIPACVNSAVTFINTSVAGFNASCSQSTVHVWQWGDGTPNTTVFTNAPQTHTYTSPGSYTVTLSTSNGCGTTTMTRTVCIEAPPVPNFTLSPSSGCVPLVSNISNLSDTSLSCDVNWNWVVTFNGSPCTPASGAFSFTNGTNANSWQPQITFNSQGTYTVTLQLINSCGTFTFNQTVTVHKVPEITFPALPNICAGQSISPTATFLDCTAPITAYSWTFPGGVPATFNQEIPGSVSFAAAGNPTITVSATNICGTTNATQPLTITAAPPAPVAGSNSPLCEGATLDLTASNIANANYQWSGPNGFTSTTQNPSITNVTVANSGSYSVFATVNGCAGSSASTNVVINPAPVVSILPVNPSICAGQSVLLTGNGATTYVWNDGTGNVGTNATLNVSPAATTTYTLTGTTAGCSAQATTTVTVNPAPIVNAGPDLTLCNQPIGEQLNGTPAGGTWSGTGITSGGFFTPSTVGVFVMTYSFTDGNGCTSTDDASITVNDPVPVVMGANQSVCLNAVPINVTANPAGGVWSGTGVSAAGVFSPSTVGTFTLIYTLGTGTCATSGTLDVTVNPLPVINPGAPINVCSDAVVQNLNATPLGGIWSGSGVSGLTFDPALAGVGVHNITYSFTDGNGCLNTGNLSATVNALPIVNAGADQIVCDQPIPVVLSGTPAGGTWSGPNVTAGGLFTPNGTGVFALTYSFTDGNGCSSNDQMNVTVVAPTPADAGLPQSVCHNAAAITLNGIPAGGTWSGTNITAGGIFTPSTVGVFTLTYSFGTGTCATTDDVQVTVNALPVVNAGVDFQLCVDAAPINLNGTPAGGTWSGTGITNPTGVFSPAVAGVGTHVLTYTFTDANGCANSDQLNATINALPVVNAGADTTVCDLPIPVTLAGTPAGGNWSGTNITTGGVFTPNGTGAFTVTYTFTLGTGCTASDDRVVNVIAPQQANAGPDQEICHNASAITINGLPAGGTWSGSFVTAGGLFTPSTPGTYNLTYTFGVGNCQTSDVMQIIVHPLPVVNAGIDQNICIDAAVTTLTGTPVGGTWSGIGITNVALGTFDPFVAGVGAHNITYTFTNPVTGCLNSDVMVMNVQPLPVMGFSNNPIACVGIAEAFTNTTTGAISYAWNFGDGNTSTQTNPQHAYTAVGTYTISLTATSLFGCVNSTTGSIDVFEPPVANFTLAPDSACGPLVVNFNNLSSGQSISYNWDFGNGTTSALAAPGAVTYPAGYLADTTYSIVLSVSNFCATVTHTEQVIVMPEPKAIFGTNVNVGCSPFTPEIANNSVGLPDTYFWNFGDGTTGNQPDALFGHTFYTGLEDTTFTIMLVVTNECGVDTAYHTITVLPNTVNAFFNSSDTSGCVPLAVNFTQFSTGATFSSWDFGDGNVSTAPNPSHTFTLAGTYLVQLFINDGCSFDTATINITVHPQPQIDFSTTPDSVCASQPFQFNNLSSNLASVNWNFGDGNTSVLTNPIHTYGLSGTYMVTLSGVSTVFGCSTSVTRPVVVRTTPVASFTPDPLFGCEPLPVNFQNTSTQAQFFSWNFGDGNGSVQVNPSHTYATSGTYTITLMATNLNGCSDTAVQSVLVNLNPIAAFSTSSPSSCYSPVTMNITNLSSGAVGYTWNLGNGQTSALTNPSVTYTQPGSYTITLIAETPFGCLDTATYVYVVYPTPVANFSMPSDTSCELYPVLFTNLSQNATSYQWSFGDGSTSVQQNPAHNYADSGLYSVTLMVYGAGGCGDTITLNNTLTIFPSPTAGFTWINVQNVDPLSGTVEFTNTSTGAIGYEWHFGNGQTSIEVNPVHRYNRYGNWSAYLVAVNEYGCMDTAYQNIVVDFFKGLFAPNAMYPGHPDFGVAHFIPTGVGLKSFRVSIYDDWGNLIWECSDIIDTRPACAWDGTFNGAPVQQDAYVWKIEAFFLDESLWVGQLYPNGLYRAAGTVTVIR